MQFPFLTSIGVNVDVSILWKKKKLYCPLYWSKQGKSDIVIKNMEGIQISYFTCIWKWKMKFEAFYKEAYDAEMEELRETLPAEPPVYGDQRIPVIC